MLEKIKIAFEKGYDIDKAGNVIGKDGHFKTLQKYKSYNGKKCFYRFRIKIKGNTVSLPVYQMQAYKNFGDKCYEKNINIINLNGDLSDNSWDNIIIKEHK